MFNKKEFSIILSKINKSYQTMTEFAQKADCDRTYISKYINMKLDNPPTPKILEKIANASNGIVTYKQLMLMCNYLDDGLNDISGECIKLFGNPYIDRTKCSTSEEYIFNVIYSYEILEVSDYTDSEKKQIIDSYNYIKNDKDYSKYLVKHAKLKKQYYEKQNESDPLGLAKVGFSMDKYVPPTDAQREQIKGLLEVILKDNKKDKENQ